MFSKNACVIPVAVFFAYALVTRTDAILYIDAAQIDDIVRTHLGSDVVIKPYDAIWEDLKQYGQSLGTAVQEVCMSYNHHLIILVTDDYSGATSPFGKQNESCYISCTRRGQSERLRSDNFTDSSDSFRRGL